MCFEDRNTLSRGRSAVPRTFLRTRNRFRWRVTARRFCAFIVVGPFRFCEASLKSTAAGERLAFLAADHFRIVADALALVRLRLAGGTHVGRELADLLLVG